MTTKRQDTDRATFAGVVYESTGKLWIAKEFRQRQLGQTMMAHRMVKLDFDELMIASERLELSDSAAALKHIALFSEFGNGSGVHPWEKSAAREQAWEKFKSDFIEGAV